MIYQVNIEEMGIVEKHSHCIFIGNNAAANDSSLLIKNAIQGIVTVGIENEPEKFSNVVNGYFTVNAGKRILYGRGRKLGLSESKMGYGEVIGGKLLQKIYFLK